MLLMLSSIQPAHAQERSVFPAPPIPTPDILVAGSDNQSFNLLFRDRLQQALPRDTTISTYSREASIASPEALVIAVGSSAVNDVVQQEPRPPMLALMISDTQFEQYADLTGAPLSAIYLNPPLKRQALLGQQILPQASTLAILAQAGEEQRFHELANELEAFGLELRVFTVTSPGNLVATLNRALNFADFLLGTPDPEVYNRQTIKHILLTTYRHNRVLIGPERAFVQAGALASTYTPTEIIIERATDIAQQFMSDGTLPAASYPEQFSVLFNKQVARSLNIPLPDKDAIVQRLRALESQQTGAGND